MLFGQNRLQLRLFYHQCWRKHQEQLPCTELEKQVISVITLHPEYHDIVSSQQHLDKEWFPEIGVTNPYLHMGLHLAIREQLSTNSPQGIRIQAKKILQTIKDPHLAEHAIMDCLEMTMQKNTDQNSFDTNWYLKRLQEIVN